MQIPELLLRDRTVDITTTGARSGQPQRIEIWTWIADDRVYLTGSPGRRAWYANAPADVGNFEMPVVLSPAEATNPNTNYVRGLDGLYVFTTNAQGIFLAYPGAHDLGSDAERVRRFFQDLDAALQGVTGG